MLFWEYVMSMDNSSFEINNGLKILILYMKMRWFMIGKEHINDYSIKSADFRHLSNVCYKNNHF